MQTNRTGESVASSNERIKPADRSGFVGKERTMMPSFLVFVGVCGLPMGSSSL